MEPPLNMEDRSIHPNTRILLDAWRRMNAAPEEFSLHGPRANEHPDLLTNLFVIQATEDRAWEFRSAGDGLRALLGRELAHHDFLSLWTGPDRAMMAGFLDAVHLDGGPGVIRGRGETLTGQRAEVEITVMPLASSQSGSRENRFLGLYQTLGGVPTLRGRPIWRHRISMLVPPDTRPESPALKVVSSND